MVLISVIVLKDRYTVNMGVSAAALALCTAFLIFFVFRRERWNLWSVMSAAAFLLINPVVSAYAVLIIAVSARWISSMVASETRKATRILYR